MKKRQQAPGELELARSFLNTLDIEDETDAFRDPAALASWLTDHGLAPGRVRATQSDLRSAQEVRAALRSMLLAHNGHAVDPDAGRTLDRAARRAKLQLRFEGGERSRLEPEASGVAGALGRLLAIVHRAIADGSWERLKACRLDSCQWAFFDHTKNRSGAWCTMEVCGNRAKARTYRERRARSSHPAGDPAAMSRSPTRE